MSRNYGTIDPEVDGSPTWPRELRRNSALLTAGILIADIVGAGVLSMGMVVAQVGWLLGTIIIVLSFAMNTHISIILWSAYMKYPHSRTMVELTEAAFSKAPDWQRNWAPFLVGVAQLAFIFSVLGAYILTIGKGLGMLLYNLRLCLPEWGLVACAIIFPIHASGRTLGHWSSMIWGNCLLLLVAVGIPIVYMAHEGVAESRPPGATFGPVAPGVTFLDIASSSSICAFAFSGQFLLVEIIYEMRDRQEFPKAFLQFSGPFQLILYLGIGILGYYFRGSAASGLVVEDIPFGTCLRIAGLLMALHMVISYVIKGIVFCRATFGAVSKRDVDEDSLWTRTSWATVVFVTLATSWTLSQLIPFFANYVDLMGALVVPVGCYLTPIFIYLRCWYDAGARVRDVHWVEWLALAVEVAVSGLLIVAGTVAAVSSIVQAWAALGPPFSCHCEGMWNTCACSSKHAGMETCLLKPSPGLL